MFNDSQVASSDFDGDRASDIIWRHYGTGQNRLWYMVGNRLHQSAALPAQIDLGWEIKGSGDFDGDNRSDLIWRNETTGENALWLMNNVTLLRELHIVSIGDSAWDISGVGDFNNDGRSDLVWRNEQTGQGAIWYMDGAVPQHAEALASETNTQWQIAGVGDFNADGQDDLFWRDRTTGHSRIWTMQGATRQASLDLGLIHGTEWQVQGVGDFNRDGLAEVLWRHQEVGLELSHFNNDQLIETQTVEIADVQERRQVSDPHWQASTSGTTDQEPALRLNWSRRTIVPGETYTVTWDSAGQTAPTAPQALSRWGSHPTNTVKLSLYRDDQFLQNLGTTIPDQGLHHWTVPTSLQPGHYRLRIASNDDQTQFDYSDLPFTVETPQLHLNRLNRGQSLQAGQSYEITWSSNFSNRLQAVTLDLYKGGQWLRNIESSTVNDGSTTWQVPDDLPVASDYQIRISTSAPAANRLPVITDWSDEYLAIEAKPDLDIQLFDYQGVFDARQWRVLNQAAENWERIITSDKDRRGQARVVVTQAPGRIDGGQWETARSVILAEAFVDSAIDRRSNYRGFKVDLAGVDYDNRVNWNPRTIQTMDDGELLFTMMHELGHVLGLQHVEEAGALMFFRNATPDAGIQITEESLNNLERLGYGVDRVVARQLR